MEIVKLLNPTLICIESKMRIKEKEIWLQGYCKPIELRRDKKQGGGIWLSFKSELYKKVTLLDMGNDENEQIWVELELGKENVIIGIVYGKQETRTDNENRENFISMIEEYAIKSSKEKKPLLVIGDFNMKIGLNSNDPNKKEFSAGGRKLQKMISRQNLKILNESPKCKGKWTRISTTNPDNDNMKSILDLFIANESGYEKMSNMVIDDNREFTLEKVTKNKIVGSDHSTIVADFDFSPVPYQKTISNKNTEYKWVLSKESLQRFKNETEKGTLGDIWDQPMGTIEDLYMMWIRNLNKTLKSNVKRIFKKGSKKGNIKENLGITSIRREKRMLKKKLLNAIKEKINLWKIS